MQENLLIILCASAVLRLNWCFYCNVGPASRANNTEKYCLCNILYLFKGQEKWWAKKVERTVADVNADAFFP